MDEFIVWNGQGSTRLITLGSFNVIWWQLYPKSGPRDESLLLIRCNGGLNGVAVIDDLHNDESKVTSRIVLQLFHRVLDPRCPRIGMTVGGHPIELTCPETFEVSHE